MHTYKPPGKLMYIAGPCYGYRYKPPGKLMYIAGSCYVPIYILARYIAIFPYVHSRSSGRWARPQVRPLLPCCNTLQCDNAVET